MSQRANSFKIGLFVIIAVAMLLVGLSLLGVRALFRPTLAAETYFTESISGLNVGAPVKLRGVAMGKVRRIGFVDEKYHIDHAGADDVSTREWVLVEMQLDLGTESSDQREQRARRMIADGLRVRTASAGLTGGTYLELMFAGPGTAAPVSISWTPDELYIPSAPSLMGQIESAAERIASQLERADIASLLTSFTDLARNVDAKVNDLDVDRLQESALSLVSELKQTTARLQGILDNPAIDQAVDDFAKVAGALRTSIGDQGGDLALFVQELPEVTARLRGAVGEVESLLKDEQTKRTLANLARASDSLPGASEDLRLLARRLETLLASQQQDITTIISALRRTMTNADAITEDARRNPARLLLGDPPPTLNPGAPRGDK